MKDSDWLEVKVLTLIENLDLVLGHRQTSMPLKKSNFK